MRRRASPSSIAAAVSPAPRKRFAIFAGAALRERQIEAQAAADALIELDAATGPQATAEKLAEQGFGPRLKSTADDVLARLNAKRTQAA